MTCNTGWLTATNLDSYIPTKSLNLSKGPIYVTPKMYQIRISQWVLNFPFVMPRVLQDFKAGKPVKGEVDPVGPWR